MNRSVFMFTFLFKNSSFPENSPVVQWLDSTFSLQSSLGSILVEELRFSQVVQPKKKFTSPKHEPYTVFRILLCLPHPSKYIHIPNTYIYIYIYVYIMCVYIHVCVHMC